VLNGSGLSPFGGAAAAAPQVVVPAYDADGNLLSDGASTYAWDAENRLIAMETGPAGARTRMTCVYDDQGRRTRKTLSAWSTDHWSPVTDHFFLYDGWNLICEYTDTPTPPYSVTNLYVWGLDLSGTLQGAGGIGGLLSLTQVSAFTLHPSFDGSGNVVGLVDAATGEAAARYEYGPFGELLRADGPSAESNPFRFSTKYADRFPAAPDATLYYYGYRHYSPAHARWLSRDPLGEDGGANLYGFVMNCPQTHTDAYGDSARRVVSDFFVGARVAAGDVMSLVSGDAFDSANYVSDIPAGQCSVTITINGIMNSEESAARLEDLARRAQRYSGSYVIRVKNATHYAGDFVQILGHELGIIDVAASRTAHQIQLARQALARNRCCCASIQVMAHSQGTMVFNRALPLLDKETRAMVCFTGFGGQKAVSSSAGLRAVENYGNQNDWVWRANSNPFRWMDYTFYTQDHPLNVTKSPAPGRMEHSFEPHYASLLASLQPNCSCKDTP
jgi:RHS repeat-associated protein